MDIPYSDKPLEPVARPKQAPVTSVRGLSNRSLRGDCNHGKELLCQLRSPPVWILPPATRAVDLMKGQRAPRHHPRAASAAWAAFGGLFELDCTDMPHPVLITGTDGVGTKLRIAQLHGQA